MARKGNPTRDTTLSYQVRAQIRLRTYGDALDYMERLTPAQQKKAHWVEVRAFLHSERLWTKAHLTRSIERAANKESE